MFSEVVSQWEEEEEEGGQSLRSDYFIDDAVWRSWTLLSVIFSVMILQRPKKLECTFKMLTDTSLQNCTGRVMLSLCLYGEGIMGIIWSSSKSFNTRTFSFLHSKR